MEEIIEKLVALREDKPYIYLTNDIIKEYIEQDIELLIKEIKKSLEDILGSDKE